MKQLTALDAVFECQRFELQLRQFEICLIDRLDSFELYWLILIGNIPLEPIDKSNQPHLWGLLNFHDWLNGNTFGSFWLDRSWGSFFRGLFGLRVPVVDCETAKREDGDATEDEVVPVERGYFLFD